MGIFNKIFNKTQETEAKTIAEDARDEINEQVLEEEKLGDNEVTEEEESYEEEEVSTSQRDESVSSDLEEGKPQGLFSKLFKGLAKTRDNILSSVDNVISSFKKIDEELFEELEEVLIMADFGVETTEVIMDRLRDEVKEKRLTEPLQLKEALKEIIKDILTVQKDEDILDSPKPVVILVIGVNGAGKTTTIGKLSHLFKQKGKKVLVAAADTFRAAAIDQLEVWTKRAGVEIIKHNEGSDPASVVYDAIAAAKSRKADILICDTAGRLQNKTNLMKELEKISRIIEREYPEAQKEVLIVLDATTGQNAISQVKTFKEITNLNGIVLTKLDGTAKGGTIVGIYSSMKIPVKYVGVGEKMDDLQKFNSEEFAKALLNEKE